MNDEIHLIFLDIDGVLNSEAFAIWCADTSDGNLFLKNGGDHWVDPNAVNMLVTLCNIYNIKIVITSSWRLNTLQETIIDLSSYKDLLPLVPLIIGITPITNEIRGKEIKWFIDNIQKPPIKPYINYYDYDYFLGKQKYNLNYCIIDDDEDMLDEQKNNFIKINNEYGITYHNIKQIKRVLNIK